MTNSPLISARDLCLSFEREPVLDSVSFSIPDNAVSVLWGPSGTGKSCLIRIMGGLLQPDAGTIENRAKRISCVFQNDLLFDDISVMDNICYGQKTKRLHDPMLQAKAKQLAAQFRCETLLNQKTATCSGGQRKRIALARAMMKDPDLLLLDEPFSGMDAMLEQDMMQMILSLQKEKKMSVVICAHDFVQAFAMADQLLVLEKTHLIKSGFSQENESLYQRTSLNLLPLIRFDTPEGILALSPYVQEKEAGLWIDAPCQRQSCFEWLMLSRRTLGDQVILTAADGRSSTEGFYIDPDDLDLYDRNGQPVRADCEKKTALMKAVLNQSL